MRNTTPHLGADNILMLGAGGCADNGRLPLPFCASPLYVCLPPHHPRFLHLFVSTYLPHLMSAFYFSPQAATKYVPARGNITFEGIPTEEGI